MVNTTLTAVKGVRMVARVTDLTGATLMMREAKVNVGANATVEALTLPLEAALAKGPVLVRLRPSAAMARSSENFYWQAAKPEDLQALSAMPQAILKASAQVDAPSAGEQVETITLANTGQTPALQAKLTLFDAKGEQILPAYFSDNYLSLLPSETRWVTVRYPQQRGTATVRLRGWNIQDSEIK
jgi:hypothetical protein